MVRAGSLIWIVGVALAAPVAHGASSAQREFQQAMHSKPDLERGAELFRDCAGCHGPKGGGDERQGDVPRIAGQHFSVLVRQLVDYRHETRWDIRMEHYAGKRLLADPQSIADVAGYASQLARVGPRNVGDGTQVEHGAQVYAARCASCHGEHGEGNGRKTIPRLAGQHYEYLLRQMYDAVDGRRPNFSPAHIRLLGKLERADLVGVADFLARENASGPQEDVALARERDFGGGRRGERMPR